jgi:hypothetical protein
LVHLLVGLAHDGWQQASDWLQTSLGLLLHSLHWATGMHEALVSWPARMKPSRHAQPSNDGAQAIWRELATFGQELKI